MLRLEKLMIVQDGMFCTPIVTMVREQRVIVLVGTVHLGTPVYYSQIQSKLDNLERLGYCTTHESANWYSDQSAVYSAVYEGRSPEWIAAYKESQLAMKGALAFFGFVEQVNALTPRPSWVFTDPSAIEVVKDLMQHVTLENLQKTITDPLKFARRFISIAMGVCQRRSQGVPLNEEVAVKVRAYERDVDAISGILQFVGDKNVGSCWGVNHLKGMISALEESNFIVTSIEWFKCFPTRIPELE